jgi:dimethylaniline monooxygenase (N-oxide forming)
MAKRIAVIGAGAGGTCAAKYMLQAGFDATVFEAGSYIGGLWVYENDNGRAQAYRHLCIISSRRYTHFTDFEFDDQTPRFPTHWDMHRYLDGYAEHFGVKQRVRFRTPVTAVRPLFTPGVEQPRWQVTTKDGDETFDAVVVATGHLNEPSNVPEYARKFGGEYLHSSAYRVPDPYAGKRVCVVGMGNSGVDIASAVCAVADRTVIVSRSGAIIQPKVIFGIPFSDIAIGLRRRWIPARLRAKMVELLIYTAHGDTRKLGIQRPDRATHPTLSENLVMNIEYNRITVKPGITDIDGKTITFADGTKEEFDVLVGATGYKVHLPFIGPDVLPVKGNHVDLYKRIFAPTWPGLCFVGMLNPRGTLNRIFEEQSALLIRYLRGEVTLPSRAEMETDIAEKNRLSWAMYTAAPRHEMEEPDMGYVEELHRLVRDGELRARYNGNLPPWLQSPWGRALFGRASRPWTRLPMGGQQSDPHAAPTSV